MKPARHTRFEWNNRTVLLTGAGGFVGAHLVRELLAAGARVVCLLRSSARINALDLLDLRRHIEVAEGSIEDLPLIEELLRQFRVDTVFHLAAQSIIGTANHSPLATFDTNIRGTYLLLEACRVTGIPRRIVVASSDKAYGVHPILPYTEDFPLLGVSPYAVSKVCTELLVRSFAETYQLPVTICRSTNVYGPADLNFSRIVPGTFLSLLQGESPVIQSDGTPIRQLIHVEDLVQGYLRLAEQAEQFAGQAFNFGGAPPIQIRELVERLVAVAGLTDQLPPKVLQAPRLDHQVDAQVLSTAKASTLLDWQAEVALDDGLAATWIWYRDHLPALLSPLGPTLGLPAPA